MATLGELPRTIWVLVLSAIFLGVGLLILSKFLTQIETETSNTSVAYNATEDFMEGIGEFGGWVGTIVIIVAAAIIIGLVVGSLAGSNV